MVSQYKSVCGFIFLNFLITFYKVQSQQLALPNQVLMIVSKNKITVNEFVARCSDYILFQEYIT